MFINPKVKIRATKKYCKKECRFFVGTTESPGPFDSCFDYCILFDEEMVETTEGKTERLKKCKKVPLYVRV